MVSAVPSTTATTWVQLPSTTQLQEALAYWEPTQYANSRLPKLESPGWTLTSQPPAKVIWVLSTVLVSVRSEPFTSSQNETLQSLDGCGNGSTRIPSFAASKCT